MRCFSFRILNEKFPPGMFCKVQHPSQPDWVQIGCDVTIKHQVCQWKTAFSVGLLSDIDRVSVGHGGGNPWSGCTDEATVEAAMTVQTFCLCFALI